MFGPTSPRYTRHTPTCAQRLAATLMFARATVRNPAGQLAGAQRLAATLMFALVHFRSSRFCIACSTPCGDTDVCTSSRPSSKNPVTTCSTPCGDTDVCTFLPLLTIFLALCAQRLAATLMFALAAARLVVRARHSAQRLAATLMFAHIACSTSSTPPCCAQRLAATLMFAQRIRLPVAAWMAHGPALCSTPCGDTDVCTTRCRVGPHRQLIGAQRLAATLMFARRVRRHG